MSDNSNKSTVAGGNNTPGGGAGNLAFYSLH